MANMGDFSGDFDRKKSKKTRKLGYRRVKVYYKSKAKCWQERR